MRWRRKEEGNVEREWKLMRRERNRVAKKWIGARVCDVLDEGAGTRKQGQEQCNRVRTLIVAWLVIVRWSRSVGHDQEAC